MRMMQIPVPNRCYDFISLNPDAVLFFYPVASEHSVHGERSRIVMKRPFPDDIAVGRQMSHGELVEEWERAMADKPPKKSYA